MTSIDRQDIKAGNIRAYQKQAATYDAGMNREYCFPEIDAERVRRYHKWEKWGAVLEVGAGTGYAYQVCANDADPRTWVSSDISLEMLKVVRSRYPFVITVVCDAENMPFKDGVFNCVVCSSMMHHLPDDDRLLREANRALKKSGAFISLHEPNMEGCDFWMRLRYLVNRYADRKGLRQLLKLVVGGPKGRKSIFSYNLSQEELATLDRYEIRGSILHRTKTKERGGISPNKLKINGRQVFGRSIVVRFGFFGEMLFLLSLFSRRRWGLIPMRVASRLDLLLYAIGAKVQFSDLMLLCVKQDGTGK